MADAEQFLDIALADARRISAALAPIRHWYDEVPDLPSLLEALVEDTLRDRTEALALLAERDQLKAHLRRERNEQEK